MRVSSFWAQGYRSLRDVKLEKLGEHVVFYGPNGSGKSNLLQGIASLFGIVRTIGVRAAAGRLITGDAPEARELGEALLTTGVIAARDVAVGATGFVLGATCVDVPVSGLSQGTDLASITIEVTVDLTVAQAPLARLSRLEFDGRELAARGLPLAKLLAETLPSGFSLVDSDRFPGAEQASTSTSEDRDPVLTHLASGHLKSALFVAQNSPDRGVRDRLRVLRSLLEGPPLKRPPFDAVQDPFTLELDVREPLGATDVSLDRLGLGVAQLYAILGSIVLSGARSVAVEEPEAHLHAPTSGIALRQLLARLVGEKVIDQLFVATHSNLFDLDPTGYWDFRLVDGATLVSRAELARIDHDHLYEPGPAKHALAQLLVYAPPSEIVFRRPDGTPVTAAEMLQLLQADDATAVDYLRTLHGAALRIVRLDAQRGATP